MNTVKSLAAAALLTAAISTAASAEWWRGDSALPEVSAMRAYRISQLSDEEIRELHRLARETHAFLRREAKERADEFWKKYREECGKALDDPAYRVRNPLACNAPLGNLDEPLDRRPVEVIFDHNILGICNFIWTTRDAKKSGCLPPD
jgi:hypothetical protein